MTLTLTTKAWGSEVSWNIDGNVVSDRTYGQNAEYTQTVCLAPGDHTLNMIDSYGDGWHGGSISIGNVLSGAGSDFNSGATASATFTV
jgi:hypothetical protein